MAGPFNIVATVNDDNEFPPSVRQALASSPEIRQVAASAPAPVVFNHGTNANAIRPSTATMVIWTGKVNPNNALVGDLWAPEAVSA